MPINVGTVEAVLIARDELSPVMVTAAERVVELRRALAESQEVLNLTTTNYNALATTVGASHEEIKQASLAVKVAGEAQSGLTLRVNEAEAAFKRMVITESDHAVLSKAAADQRAAAAEMVTAAVEASTTQQVAAAERAIGADNAITSAVVANASKQVEARIAEAAAVNTAVSGSAAAAGFTPVPGSPIAGTSAATYESWARSGGAIAAAEARVANLYAQAGAIGGTTKEITELSTRLVSAENNLRAMSDIQNVVNIRMATLRGTTVEGAAAFEQLSASGQKAVLGARALVTAETESAAASAVAAGGLRNVGAASAEAGGAMEGMDRLASRMIERLLILYAIRGTFNFVTGLYEGAQALERLNEQTKLSVSLLHDIEMESGRLGIPFNTVTSALDALGKNLSQVKGTTLQALLDIGLSFEKVFAVKPDERLKLIIEAIAGLETQSQRTKAEIALFGTDAIDSLVKKFRDIPITVGEAAEAYNSHNAILASADRAYHSAGESIKEFGVNIFGAGIKAAEFMATPFMIWWQKTGGLVNDPNAPMGFKYQEDVGSPQQDPHWFVKMMAAMSPLGGLIDIRTLPPMPDHPMLPPNAAPGSIPPDAPLMGDAYIAQLRKQAQEVDHLTSAQLRQLQALRDLNQLNVDSAARMGVTPTQFKEYMDQHTALAKDSAQEVLGYQRAELEATEQGYRLKYDLLQADHDAKMAAIAGENKSSAVKHAEQLAEEASFQGKMITLVRQETEAVQRTKDQAAEAEARAAEQDGTRTLMDQVRTYEQQEVSAQNAADREFGATEGREKARQEIRDKYNTLALAAQTDFDKRYRAQHDKAQADIDALEEAGIAKGSTRFSLGYDLAQIEKQKQLRMAEVVRTPFDEDQKLDLMNQAVVRAFVASRNAITSYDALVNKEVATMDAAAQDAHINLVLTGAEREIAIAQVAYDKQIELLRARQLLDDETYAAAGRVLDAHIATIKSKYDPLWQAWLGLNVDMRNEWAKTWDSFLSSDKTFTDVTSRIIPVIGGDGITRFTTKLDEAREAYERLAKAGKSTSDELSAAMDEVVKAEQEASDKSKAMWGGLVDVVAQPFKDVGSMFTKMVSGMLADWEMQLLAPMLGSFRGTISRMFGMPTGTGSGYGSYGGGTSVGGYSLGPLQPGGGFTVSGSSSPLGGGGGDGLNWDTYGDKWWYDANGKPVGNTGRSSTGMTVAAGVAGGALQGFGADTSHGFNHAMVSGLGGDSAQGAASTVALGIATFGISVGVQAAVAALKYAFRDRTVEDVARDAGQNFGQVWSEALTEKIVAASKGQGSNGAIVGEVAGELAFLPDIIKEFPITLDNLDMYEGKLRDVYVMIAERHFTIAQGAQLLNSVFPEMARVATNSYGMISDELKEIINLNENFTTHSQAIADFLKGQGVAAGASFGGIVDYEDRGKVYDEIKARIDKALALENPDSGADEAAKNKWIEAKGKVDDEKAKYDKMVAKGESTPAQLAAQWAKYQDAIRKAAELSPDLTKALQDQADAAKDAKEKLADLGTLLIIDFAAQVGSGTPMNKVLQDMHEGIHRLAKDYDDLGLTADNPAIKELLVMDDVYSANPKALDAIGALAAGDAALGNVGLLTQERFDAEQRTAVHLQQDLYNTGISKGLSAEDAQRVSLLPMQAWLHQAQLDAERNHVALSDDTKAQIQNSKDLGIWSDNFGSDSDRLRDRIGDLIDVLSGLPLKIHDAIFPPIPAPPTKGGGNPEPEPPGTPTPEPDPRTQPGGPTVPTQDSFRRTFIDALATLPPPTFPIPGPGTPTWPGGGGNKGSRTITINIGNKKLADVVLPALDEEWITNGDAATRSLVSLGLIEQP